ncbi:MAG: hypothetical protein NTZ97_00890 [Candidatus Moranbacteria bacterium]|nr:hypothetical protein [Candidatus Moranbacteria bacterium]
MASLFTKISKVLAGWFRQEYFHSHIAMWLAVISVAANLTNWALIWIFIRPVDFPIILHYNVYFGVDMIGHWKQTYSLPAIGLFLILVNFFLAMHFYRSKNRIASYLIMMAALMVQLCLIVASASVIIINY